MYQKLAQIWGVMAIRIEFTANKMCMTGFQKKWIMVSENWSSILWQAIVTIIR